MLFYIGIGRIGQTEKAIEDGEKCRYCAYPNRKRSMRGHPNASSGSAEADERTCNAEPERPSHLPTAANPIAQTAATMPSHASHPTEILDRSLGTSALITWPIAKPSVKTRRKIRARCVVMRGLSNGRTAKASSRLATRHSSQAQSTPKERMLPVDHRGIR